MSDFIDKIRHDAFKGNYLTRLLYLNISVFLLYGLLNVFVTLFTGDRNAVQLYAIDLLALPSDPVKLLTRPWTILTYMFTHLRLRHILFNMLILYFSGKMFMEYLGQKRMLALYIYGGIGGGLLYVVISNFSPLIIQDNMVGASAGTTAVLIAGAIYLPNIPIRLWGIFELKYWMLAVGIVFFDILSLTGNNAGGHIAHLGGAMVAYFFIRSMRNGHEWNVYLFQVIDAVRNTLYRNSRKRRGFKFGERNYTKYEEVKTKKANTTNPDTSKMDEILDKIKEKGYDSLSKEEKAYLFKISKDQ